ncbi:ankyrin repeat-containing domain protein [Baffinella frigidus]|nr:ankyrin repeat-containing domain protein [Cryptophyta sp. CCMP2293]
MPAKAAPGKAPASPSRSPTRGPGGASPTRAGTSPAKARAGASPVKGRTGASSPTGAVKGKGRDARIRGRQDANAGLEEASAKEKKDAMKILKAHATAVLEKVQSAESEIDLREREPIESMCREVLFWLDTRDASRAITSDFQKSMERLKACYAECMVATEERQKEAPLTLNIFHHDHLIVTGEGRQVVGAIKAIDKEELERLLALKHGRALVTRADERGWTPLHHAVVVGNTAIVQLLLRANAVIDAQLPWASFPRGWVRGSPQTGAQSGDGWAPIHLACMSGKHNVLMTLLASGAQVSTTTKDLEWTPLHFAASAGEVEATDNLLRAGADPNAASKDKWTPLHLASMNGHEEVAAMMVWGRIREGNLDIIPDPDRVF